VGKAAAGRVPTRLQVIARRPKADPGVIGFPAARRLDPNIRAARVIFARAAFGDDALEPDAARVAENLFAERTKAECLNAHGRRMGLRQLTVRGKEKARTVLLWFAIAHNMMRALALQQSAAALAS
jgi:hypothetical protein